ncbi:unnamed protein product [Leptosia nina]|uniref:Uncharacterized protein n=1 Tax=Leptosia nina TaxID=320188 RepID=A0AAV1JZ47_9NEOP
MGDNLPLLPEREAICTDVRPVLREVFRDEDYLPPIADCYPENHDDKTILEQKKWVDEFSSECEKFHEKEKNLKYKYAQRLSREPLPNIFKIYSDLSNGSEDSWTVVRKDLKPTIEQDAGCNTSLWVKNILNRSSGDLTVCQHEPKIPSGEAIFPPDDVTIQSYSIGEAVPRPPPPPPKLAIQPPQPEYILCVPPRIEFVNFTLGHVHTETLRLINVSKFEIRLSVTPPKRKELDVELCSRLVVTSGSAAEFRIHYRPVDVRAVADVLQVRVSVGRGLLIPISCYMRPPVLEILVPNLTSVRLDSTNPTETTADVLDLGSRLLGDVHRASVLFYCAEKHASFFLLPEDAWFSFCVDVAASSGKGKSVGGAASDNFWLSPVRWCGGGTTRAIAVCYAAEPGLHTTALRILSSTAIVRPLNLVADALWFRPTHITLLAHEKDYDICSADDPACEYYVRLGTAFPGRPLSSVIEIVNHSPLSYPYYWSVRAWGVCSCWTGSETSLLAEDDDLCDEATMLKRQKHGVNEDARAVRVESANGRLFPRSVTQLHVQVPDAGHLLGQHRAVLMLILKAVPKESFPPNYDAMIVKTEVVNEEGIPGVCSSWSREVCDIVCCQLEVWWDVVPVRFVLEPPVLKLTHSRRIKSTDICLKATQLYGVTGVKASWNVSGSKAINLLPGEAVGTNFNLQMQQLANHYPDLDVIELNAASKEWKSSCVIQRCYNTRHPSLRPALKWLGLVPPGAKVQTELVVHNDTYQHICWWVTCVRWWGERRVADVCASRAPCPQCYERSCSCAMISPTRGALAHDQKVTLKYSVIAPDIDGVVATLIQVHRTSGDVCMVPSVAGTEARATLLAYRVLAPVVVLQVLPCLGDKHKHCKVCSMDTNERKNCAVLRPSFALTAGFRSCYRLRCANLTPPTDNGQVEETACLVILGSEGEDNLRVIFLPNDFDLRGHSSIEIQGLEVVVDIPTGDGVKTDSFFSIKMMEKESARREKMVSPTELFEEEDRKRAVQKENICHCPYKMVYIPPATEPSSPLDEEYRCVDVITEPPPLTRVCPCGGKTKPVLPESEEPSCLQFRNLPVRTVQTRTMKLRNLSSLFTRIATAVRNWPRVHKRTLRSDKWADDVRTPGVIIECKASENALAPCGMVEVTVSVYADCWGLYHDQVLIMIDNVDSIVLDVWIEVVGPPLYFPLQGQCHDACTPILWMSSSDPERALVVANPSRSCLNVQTYVITENQYPQDELPFRLYLRFYYVPSRTCPCVTALDSISYADEDSDKNSSSEYSEIDGN